MEGKGSKGLLVVLVLFFITVNGELPSGMVGEWRGNPNYSVLGPWGELPFNFTIAVLNGNTSQWLMSDFFGSNELITNSLQQFWVSEGEGLTYCGLLYGFFQIPAPVAVNFTESFVNDNQIQWCYESCQEVQWTITLIDENTLNSHLFLAYPVVHFNVTLTRISTTQSKETKLEKRGFYPPYCNITLPPPDSMYDEYRKYHGEGVELNDKTLSLCPYARFFNRSLPSPQLYLDNENLKEKSHHVISDEVENVKNEVKNNAEESYEFCYTLNPAALTQLSWNFNEVQKTVDIKISMPLSSTSLSGNSPSNDVWLALGFQPSFPGMYNADIAMGYQTSSNDSCVRAMYVPEYVGTPVDDSSFVLTNQSVSVENGILSVSFTRAFDTGHHNITVGPLNNVYYWTIMWASGPAPSSCTGNPLYHSNLRGMRAIDWAKPSRTFSTYELCN